MLMRRVHSYPKPKHTDVQQTTWQRLTILNQYMSHRTKGRDRGSWTNITSGTDIINRYRGAEKL